jgi:NADPH:quinone reductase-like Zn-dependent oxidoreductase
MKAFAIDRYGSADPVDSKTRNGDFKAFLHYRLPLILGHDVAGTVVRVGSRVRRVASGDDVYAASGRAGAFAELIAIDENELAMKPAALTMEEANGGQLAQLTSLIDHGAIRPIVDRMFPFAETTEAMAYVDTGRSRGKVVVSMRQS